MIFLENYGGGGLPLSGYGPEGIITLTQYKCFGKQSLINKLETKYYQSPRTSEIN